MVPVPSRLPAFCTSSEIHGNVEMLFDQKIGRCAAGKHSAKAQAVAHAARVFFKDFAHRRAHRQFP